MNKTVRQDTSRFWPSGKRHPASHHQLWHRLWDFIAALCQVRLFFSMPDFSVRLCRALYFYRLLSGSLEIEVSAAQMSPPGLPVFIVPVGRTAVNPPVATLKGCTLLSEELVPYSWVFSNSTFIQWDSFAFFFLILTWSLLSFLNVWVDFFFNIFGNFSDTTSTSFSAPYPPTPHLPPPSLPSETRGVCKLYVNCNFWPNCTIFFIFYVIPLGYGL